MSATVSAGVAVVAVDVPTGTPLAGFAARGAVSTGVHDPTTVRALVVDDVAIVAVDVCALHESTCGEIAGRSGCPATIVTATHTHSGPCIGRGRVGRHDPVVHDAVVEAAVAAIGRACAARRAVTAAYASARGARLAKDRRHPENAIDPPVDALVLRDAVTSEPVAALVGHACHPVVLDATNTRVTADYVHFLRRELEDAWACPVVFLTGAAGDVNTGHSAEASYSGVRAAGRTFAEAERCGTAVARTLLGADPTPVDLAAGVRHEATDVELGFEPLTRHQVEADAATWRARRDSAPEGERLLLDLWIDWAERWDPARLGEPWRGRVNRVSIGAFDLVTLPGEPFLAAADALHDAGGQVLVAAYADGVPGYFPMADDYPDGGYEVRDAHRYYGMPAPFARGSAERLVAAARALLAR